MPGSDLSITNPPSIYQVLNDESPDDCLSCRITGGGAFIGLGAYSWYTGMKNLERNKTRIRASGSMFGIGPRRLGIRGISAALVGVGIYRFLN